MLRTLAIASDTGISGQARTITAVHRFLRTVGTRIIASRSHVALNAVLTPWNVQRGVTKSTIEAVWCARAVWDITRVSFPSFEARALMYCRVAFAMTAAVSFHTRTSGNLTNISAPTDARIAGAGFVGPTSAPTETQTVAALPTVARLALANPAVHWFLNSTYARLVTRGTHPSPRAVRTPRTVGVRNARTTAIAVRLSGAIEGAAIQASPSRVAVAFLQRAVTQPVTGAININPGTSRTFTVRSSEISVAHAAGIKTLPVAVALRLTKRACVTIPTAAHPFDAQPVTRTRVLAFRAAVTSLADALTEFVTFSVTSAVQRRVTFMFTSITNVAFIANTSYQFRAPTSTQTRDICSAVGQATRTVIVLVAGTGSVRTRPHTPSATFVTSQTYLTRLSVVVDRIGLAAHSSIDRDVE